MLKVTIRECKLDGRVWTSNHSTSDADEAARAAIHLHWSPRHAFHGDRALNDQVDISKTRYGQICHSEKGAGCEQTMDTGRVRIDIEPLPSSEEESS